MNQSSVKNNGVNPWIQMMMDQSTVKIHWNILINKLLINQLSVKNH